VEKLQQAGFEVVPNPYKRRYTREEIIELLDGIDGLIAGLEPLDRGVLEQHADRLKVVSRCGAGMSNVDLDAAKELGIIVRNTPDGPTQAVAELTVGSLLALLRQVPAMNSALHAGNWDKRVGSQLRGKTVAIIGYGRIGRRVGELLSSFQVKLLAVDPALVDPEVPEAQVVTLDEALQQADILALHLAGETCVLGPEQFNTMKPGMIILNAARGGSIDEEALVEALENGTVAGAWLDALPREPYEGPLANYEQVLLTPHVGSYTREGRLQMELDTVTNLIDAFDTTETR
jgi:D-3-phosphoglycerate dehydrogenase